MLTYNPQDKITAEINASCFLTALVHISIPDKQDGPDHWLFLNNHLMSEALFTLVHFCFKIAF